MEKKKLIRLASSKKGVFRKNYPTNRIHTIDPSDEIRESSHHGGMLEEQGRRGRRKSDLNLKTGRHRSTGA